VRGGTGETRISLLYITIRELIGGGHKTERTEGLYHQNITSPSSLHSTVSSPIHATTNINKGIMSQLGCNLRFCDLSGEVLSEFHHRTGGLPQYDKKSQMVLARARGSKQEPADGRMRGPVKGHRQCGVSMTLYTAQVG